MNRPFVDGSNRVALLAMDVHLRLHGLTIEVDEASAESFLVGGLDSSTLDSTTLEAWLLQVVKPLPAVD